MLFARAVAAISVLVGCVALVGWGLEIPILKSLLPGMLPMKANAAVCFILSGIAFWFLGNSDLPTARGRLSRIVTRSCAGLVLLIAGLTLFEYIAERDLGIDEMLFREPGVIHPGRIAPNAAVAFVLIHTALLLLIAAESRLRVVTAGLLGAVIGLLGLFAVLGWAGNVTIGYRWGGLTPMVAPTGFIFFLLGCGIAHRSWSRSGVRLAIDRRLLLGYVLGLLVFCALSVVSYESVHELLETAAEMREGQETLAHMESLNADSLQMQSGLRGFVITGNEAFLRPYFEGREQKQRQVAELRGRTAASAEQQSRLDELEALTAQRVAYSDEVIEARRSKGRDAAAELVSSGRGVAIRDRIRAVIAELRDDARRDLERRERTAVATIGKTFFILPVGTLIAIALSLGVLFFLNLEVTERRRAEAGAHESEERLSLALQAAEIGHWELDLVTGDERRTPLHDRIFGYSEMLPEWSYEIFLEHVHPDDRSRVNESFKAGVDAGDWDFECRIVRADQATRWIWARGHVFHDSTGHRVRMLGLVADLTERKESEAARAHLAAVVESSGDAIISKSLDGIIQTWNTGATRLFGYSPDEAVGRHVSFLIPPGREQEERGILGNLRRGETMFQFETERRRKDGTLIDVSLTLSPIKDEEGCVVAASTIVRNITARKQAEEELVRHRSHLEELVRDRTAELADINQRLLLVLDSTADGIFGLGPDGRSMLINRAALAMLGYDSPDDVLGVNAHELWHHSHADGTSYAIRDCPIYQVLSGQIGQQTGCDVFWTRRNTPFPVEYSARPIRVDDKVVGCVVSFRDITERQSMEDALRSSEARFREIFDLTPVSIWEEDWTDVISGINHLRATGVTDFAVHFREHPEFVQQMLQAVKILNVNQATLAMFEARDKGELLGSLETVFATPDTMPGFVGELQALAEGRSVHSAEMALRTVSGDLIHTLLTMSFPQSEGSTVYVGLIDVSRRKQDEEHIRQLYEDLERRTRQLEEANKELESFSYSVSHDLRAPLRHIDGYIKLLAKRESERLEPTSARYLETIARAAGKMGVLIDELLAFSRTGRQAIKTTAIDLNKLIDRSVNELAPETNGRKIAWQIDPLPKVMGDPTLLSVVMTNLLSNAIKYSGRRDEALIEIGVDNAVDGHATIFVKDNGAGFDMRYADKLFGVFQRLHRETEFEGVGIGLATVQRIVNRHGGSIWVEAEPDKGATFFVKLKKAKGENK